MTYIDDAKYKLGGREFSHLIADTSEELYTMMDKLKIDRQYLANQGKWNEHVLVCNCCKRNAAILRGVTRITEPVAMAKLLARKYGALQDSRN